MLGGCTTYYSVIIIWSCDRKPRHALCTQKLKTKCIIIIILDSLIVMKLVLFISLVVVLIQPHELSAGRVASKHLRRLDPETDPNAVYVSMEKANEMVIGSEGESKRWPLS